ncbi:MAG: hypothetical protein JMDDDDMK_05433 [Acidobacteria bacterium]|nr:hypothetical protein [Acidobacteriota bacterium]
MMRLAVLAEHAAAHSPSSGALRERAGKRPLQRSRGFAFQTVGQAQFLGGAAEQLFGGTVQQSFACAIDQTQFLFAVEREDGDFDFRHHRAGQRGGFHRAQSLRAQGRA